MFRYRMHVIHFRPANTGVQIGRHTLFSYKYSTHNTVAACLRNSVLFFPLQFLNWLVVVWNFIRIEPKRSQSHKETPCSNETRARTRGRECKNICASKKNAHIGTRALTHAYLLHYAGLFPRKCFCIAPAHSIHHWVENTRIGDEHEAWAICPQRRFDSWIYIFIYIPSVFFPSRIYVD